MMGVNFFYVYNDDLEIFQYSEKDTIQRVMNTNWLIPCRSIGNE